MTHCDLSQSDSSKWMECNGKIEMYWSEKISDIELIWRGMKPCKADDVSMASLRPRKCLEYFWSWACKVHTKMVNTVICHRESMTQRLRGELLLTTIWPCWSNLFMDVSHHHHYQLCTTTLYEPMWIPLPFAAPLTIVNSIEQEKASADRDINWPSFMTLG